MYLDIIIIIENFGRKRIDGFRGNRTDCQGKTGTITFCVF